MKQPIAIQPKVSIVLPVYNAGEFLHKCIQSLIDQTLQEIEIIIVLDCPTDGSDEVAKQYAAQDKRIIIIENEENLHVGMSRNKGIEAATGEYIGFCDHDDYAEPEMFELMYNAARNEHADISICNINCVWANGELRKKIRYPSTVSAVELKENLQQAVLRFYSKEDTGYGKFIWNMLFKKDFLYDKDLKFGDNKIITSDDCLLLSKIYYYTDKVIHCGCDKGLYNHVGHQYSAQTSYSWLNMALVTNYIIDQTTFLQNQKATRLQLLFVAEGAVRQLYTGFRRELAFQGKKYAWRQIRSTSQNRTVHVAISPLFTLQGILYAFKHLPPTKLIFGLLLYV